ncbi:MAG TPA: BTAD domain-containing putative transcriptional regulator, partial [Gemmatimonadales bacterium]|nr:BTAD domain-containing putative transcriptional regulator [Gemmatimonadales bacterium]
MIRIRTLGGLSATRDEQAPPGTATQPRRLAVLALVARAGDRGITRERLLALLWPDADVEDGRRALSQALHALRTGLHDELFLGMQDLRLNLAVASCDVLDFEAALAAQDWDRAAAAWAGPFLQGFRLAGAAEFDRWMEEERTHLTHRYAELLERLAKQAGEQGDTAAAVNWWRRRAAMDPLNARVTVGLMRALTAAGERHAALQQAKIYEALLEQELALPPDAEVARYAEELRRAPPAAAPQSHAARPSTLDPRPAPAPAPPEAPPVIARPSTLDPRSRRGLIRVAVALLLVAAAVAALRARRGPDPLPLLAVGAIADYRGSGDTGPLTDMLATNLARIPGLQVVSTARLLELIARENRSPDAAGYASAARRAGASDLMEGGIHSVPGGLLLELRRVGLGNGRVLGAWRLEGTDLFALVDSATVAVSASLGRGPMLGPGGVGTRSLVAWKFYEEGLRDYVRGDYRSALGLFEAAMREDSAFAMAVYYRARSWNGMGRDPDPADLARLERLAPGVGDRERLQILAWTAHAVQSPALEALADTLIIRFPDDIEAQFLAGFARMARAEFAAALPWLHRVVAADSGLPGPERGRCLSCEALGHLIYAYHALDSLPRAERIARDWIRREPESSAAWAYLGSVLDVTGRSEEAIAARRRAVPFDGSDDIFPIAVRIRSGDFEAADRAARALIADGRDFGSASRGSLTLAISLRTQARWRELRDLLATRLQALEAPDRAGERGWRIQVWDAVALLESGRPVEASRLLDSLLRRVPRDAPPGVLARSLTPWYALLAESAFASGDAALAARAA